MTTQVIIDRPMKAVRIEVEKVIDACWLGYKFAMQHRDLADQDWNIICYKPGDLPSVGLEQYVLEDDAGLPFGTTTYWVDAIAWWIKHPTQPPRCSHCGKVA